MYLAMAFRIMFLGTFFFICSLIAQSDKVAHIFNSKVPTYMQKAGVPGMAVGLYYKGKIYYFNFGYAIPHTKTPVTEHTVFEVGSITKSFTATLLASEVLKHNIALTDTIGSHLSSLPQSSVLRKITVEQLATHTSSLPRTPPVPKVHMSKARVLRAVSTWRPEHPIGSRYHYSNLGYILLGYVLESEMHMPYMKAVDQMILGPLQMTDTMIRANKKERSLYAQGHNKRGVPVPRMHTNALGAAGALKSTMIDMMKFLRANLGVYGPPSLIEAMKFTHKGLFKVDEHMTQALSWKCIKYHGINLIDKDGGVTGFSTWMGFIESDSIGLILLTNKRNAQLTVLGRKLLADISALTPPLKKSQMQKKLAKS